MDKSTLIVIAALAMVLVAVSYFFSSKRNPDELDSGSHELLLKLSDPDIYSDSRIEGYRYIDTESEVLNRQALEKMKIGDLGAAKKMLHQAIKNYRGFQGYHYMELHNALAIAYKREGDVEN